MRPLTVKEYIARKIQILKQLGITLTSDQLLHIKSLRTDYEVDRYARDIIMHSDDDENATVTIIRPVKSTYTVQDIAAKLRVCQATVLNWIKSGRLKGYRAVDKNIVRYIVYKNELDRFLSVNPKYAIRTQGVMKKIT